MKYYSYIQFCHTTVEVSHLLVHNTYTPLHLLTNFNFSYKLLCRFRLFSVDRLLLVMCDLTDSFVGGTLRTESDNYRQRGCCIIAKVLQL